MQQVILLVVGGMHPPSYTEQMVATIAQGGAAQDGTLSGFARVVSAPQHSLDVLSPFALRQTLEAALAKSDSALDDAPPGLIIWAFSAGCVGAAALATYWQSYRGPVLGLFMVDGWGVPRDPGVPVYRLSHDRFTHDTSSWLGIGDDDFYADPAVPHLSLWQHPQKTIGWAVTSGQPRERLTAADFLCQRSQACLAQYALTIS